eukprot:2872429-Pyramimonas_sp.AAC.1
MRHSTSCQARSLREMPTSRAHSANQALGASPCSWNFLQTGGRAGGPLRPAVWTLSCAASCSTFLHSLYLTPASSQSIQHARRSSTSAASARA